MNQTEVKKRLSAFEFIDLVGPVSESDIETAEAEIGMKLPPQYRSFISSFGCGGINSEEIIGLGGPEHLDLIKLTKRLRKRLHPLPQQLLPLRGDGFGNYDCIDMSDPTEDGEYRVIEWNHEGEGIDAVRSLADCFDQWFESVLTMAEA